MFKPFKKSERFWPDLKIQDLLVLGGGLLVFVGLAMSTITKFSIWFDEAFGSYLVRFNLFEISKYTAYDVHPPFYYWLLKIWTMAFGNTEMGLRSMSLFFGAITIVLAFLLVIKLFGRRTAYASLVFLILSPVLIRYSQEARMYTLITSIILAATYTLIYAQEHAKKRWPWVVYGVLVALGMLTQYFVALAWIAHWVWRVSIVRRHDESWKKTIKSLFSRQWVVAHIVAIGLFLPWLPFMVMQVAIVQGMGFWVPPISVVTVPDFFSTYLLFSEGREIKSWLTIGAFVSIAFVGYLVYRLIGSLKGAQKDYYKLFLCMSIVPILLLLVLSLPPLRPVFVDRYLMVSFVFLSLLIGVSLLTAKDLVNQRTRLLGGVLIAIVLAFGVYNQMIIGNYSRASKQSHNVHQLVEAINAVDKETAIVANEPWIFYESVVYETQETPIYFVEESTSYRYGSLEMLKQNDDHKIKDLDKFSEENDTFWLIGNLRTGKLNILRDSWVKGQTITINDDLSGEPLFQAVKISVE